MSAEQLSTTAFVCVHGVGVHQAGALTEETLGAVVLGAREASGTVELLELPDDAPSELTHRAQVRVPGHEPFLADFYDGWWHSRVRHPNFMVVLFWLLEVAPFIMLSAAGGWFSDRLRRAGSRFSGRLSALLTTAALVTLTPLLALVLVVALPAAGLVPSLRHRLHPVMVDILGDVWLYRSAELDSSVLPHLCRIVRLARGRADRVTLVGHSQGAELSRRVALESSPERCVWVASGEHQLNTIRMLTSTRWMPLVVWPFLLAWPVVLHLVIGWAVGGGPLDASGEAGIQDTAGPGIWVVALRLLAVVAGLGVYGLAVAGVLRRLRRAPDDVGDVPRSRIWVVKSLLDPISYGTITGGRAVEDPQDPPTPAPRTVDVRYVPPHPDQPWWREHVTYFSRPGTGAVIAEAGLDEPVPLLPATDPRVPGWVVALAPVGTGVFLFLAWLLGGLIAP